MRKNGPRANRLTTALTVGLIVGGLGLPRAQETKSTLIALKTTTEHPPNPVDGVVTLSLPSGAWIRLRAVDIDYDRTAVYTKMVDVKADTATKMTDRASGREYLNITFSRAFGATAWVTDVDYQVMNEAFLAYRIVLSHKPTTPGGSIGSKC